MPTRGHTSRQAWETIEIIHRYIYTSITQDLNKPSLREIAEHVQKEANRSFCLATARYYVRKMTDLGILTEREGRRPAYQLSVPYKKYYYGKNGYKTGAEYHTEN